MYGRRLRIFITICLVLVTVALGRLAQLQLLHRQEYMKKIEALRYKAPIQLPTVRGKILDCKGRILAQDKPRFYIYLNYQLTRVLDHRWQQAQYQRRTSEDKKPEQLEKELRDEYENEIANLYHIIGTCAELLDVPEYTIEEKIQDINDKLWNLRTFFAWGKYRPDPELVKKYDKWYKVPLIEALLDFRKTVPDRKERISRANNIDILEMYHDYRVVELDNEDDVLSARISFIDIDDVRISAESARHYPYNSTASQIIGWVRPVGARQRHLFSQDELASYQDRETAGFRGVEYVCETVLRGRRGKVEYNKDMELIERTETRFGSDVQLTIDAEFQKHIENLLTDPNRNPDFYNTGTSAVVIDVDSAQILAIASLPVFNLNDARSGYDRLIKDPCKPMVNRALQLAYPPGSSVKPLILAAGMQERKVSSEEVISCPSHKADEGWPNCWIWREFRVGHDSIWAGRGQNKARNAIKGSCNIYFSKVAHRLKGEDLQKWLYRFGYGREALPGPDFLSLGLPVPEDVELDRNLRQTVGAIWSGFPSSNEKPLEQLPDIKRYDKKWFGIGQGSIRTTVLQVANAMACIARGGVYIRSQLFKQNITETGENIGLSAHTLNVLRDGMDAVVNESQGTARKAFVDFDSKAMQIKIYGKTGSTQSPEHAWFSGFVEDNSGRKIALAVLVEGGQSGAQDAAPLAREVIRLAVQDGYIGEPVVEKEQQ